MGEFFHGVLLYGLAIAGIVRNYFIRLPGETRTGKNKNDQQQTFHGDEGKGLAACGCQRPGIMILFFVYLVLHVPCSIDQDWYWPALSEAKGCHARLYSCPAIEHSVRWLCGIR